MGPDLWELFEDGNENDEIAAIVRLGHFTVLPQEVRVVTQFSEIVTVRLTRGNLPKVSGAPEVVSMSAGDTYLGPDVELESADLSELSSAESRPTDERRPKDESATGRGVVVGVVDWGFDFAHPDFRKPDGTTRILALWDQRGGKFPNSPQPFGYGKVHTPEAINQALKAKDPYAALGYHPADADTGIGCHGTHVASIAAGSGGPSRPTGVAPEADLVLVHNAPWGDSDNARLGDSVTLLEGIDFIARTAGDHPWVVNLSMGRHGEQHDGSTLVEQGLDAAVRLLPGRAVCLSTGNYFDKHIHASGQLRPTQERTFVWQINEGQPTYNELEVWYSWQDRFEVQIRSPDHSLAARVKIGERARLLVSGKEVGNVYHRGQVPNNLDNHIHIFLYREAPAGAWEVTLIGSDIIDGRFHAWIERDVSCPRCQSHFRAQDADPRSTTGTICNGRRTLAVGAYNNHDPEQRVAHFSSVGPTRDGRLKPDLSAPGVAVLAARSATKKGREETPLLTRMSGTSMATPHVTGTVALMFEAAPRRLRIEETHNLLLASAERVSVPEDIPDRVGIGYLDIEEAVKAARQLGSVSPILKQVGTEKPTLAKPGTNGKAAPIKPEAEIMTTEGPKAEVAEGLAEHAAAEASTESKEGFFAPAEIGRKDAPAGSGIRPTDADLRALLSSPDCQKRLKGLHVAVVGGGFAGLMAARMLGQHGIKVTLFEARTEVGGRVRSNHTFSTGRIIEEGAELVGSFHTTWLRLALEYRLGMISRMDEHLYALEGLTTKITLDKDLSIKEAKDLNDAMRTRVLEPLAHLADKEIKDPSQPWLEPGLNKFDGMTVEDALPKFCQIAKRIKGNPDEELWRMLEFKLVNDEVGPLDTMNFLGLLCKIKAGQGKRLIDVSSVGCKVESGKCVITDPKLMGYWDELEIFRCADGCQQLALEMKKEIINKHNGDIHLRTAVKVIDISKKDIQLRWASVIDDKEPAVGTENSGHFDFVILAIPPSVWDRVTFIADGGIVTIGTMGMSPAVKFFSETDSRFWIDSRLAPYGGALTLGQIWEGTDNQTRTGQQKIVVSVFAGPIIDDRGSRRAPTKDECNDRLHKHFDGFTSTKAPLYSNWPQEPFIRTGYASPRLHDVFILGKLLNEPFYDLMFFAGEHTRMDFFGYMEGALRSGEDASRLLMWQACSQLSKAPAQSSTTPVRRSKEGDSESATQNGEKAAGSCGCQHREAALQAAQGEALEREAADFVDWSEQKSTEREAGVETESFFSSELAEVSARQRESDLVEMADQIVAEQTSAGRATPILHEMLSRAGLAEALTVPGSERLPLAAEIFDSLAYPCRSALRELLELVFEVVSAPGSVLNRALQPGDLQIRRALGEGPLAHVALLATGDVLRAEQLALAGLRPESPQSGLYVQVVDGGVYAHGTEARFARRLTRSDGRLDWDQMVLRIRPEALPSQAMPRIRGESSERSGSPEDAADHEYPDFGSFTPPAESVPMDVVFDDIDSTVTPPEMRPRRISTAADLRARPQQHEFEDSAHKKLLFLFGEAAFATPFYRDVGGNIEIALRSRVMFPADPADAGKLAKSNRPFPVALIVHGNHAAFDSFSYVKDGREATFPDGTKIPVVTVTNVTPVDSFMGYHFLQVELARHGIVSMSVDHDAANFLDLLVTTRAELVMQYLDQLRRLAENKASPFYNRLDFQKVALIGHSRGGDGVIASLQVNARRPDKNQFGVQSIVALAPSDMTGSLVDRQQLKIGPARGEKLLVVYGSYDGDISGFCGSLEFTGTGFRHYDRSSTHRAMVFIHRACHNRFNTLWGTESDVPADVIEASSHHHLAQEYIGGWLRMLLYGEWAQEGLFTGATANRLAQPVSLQWKFGRKLQTIDRMDDNDDIHNTLGGSVTKPSYVREIVIATEGPLNFPHQDRVLKADVPTGKPAPYRSSIPAANRDFSQFELLTFRITKKYPIDSQKAINDAPWPDFTITLEDGDGNRGSISGARILDLNKRKTKPVFRTMIDNSCTGDGSVVTQNITKINLETWQVPLSLFRSLPKFNLADIQAVEFDFRAVAGQPILVDTISLVKI